MFENNAAQQIEPCSQMQQHVWNITSPSVSPQTPQPYTTKRTRQALSVIRRATEWLLACEIHQAGYANGRLCKRQVMPRQVMPGAPGHRAADRSKFLGDSRQKSPGHAQDSSPRGAGNKPPGSVVLENGAHLPLRIPPGSVFLENGAHLHLRGPPRSRNKHICAARTRIPRERDTFCTADALPAREIHTFAPSNWQHCRIPRLGRVAHSPGQRPELAALRIPPGGVVLENGAHLPLRCPPRLRKKHICAARTRIPREWCTFLHGRGTPRLRNTHVCAVRMRIPRELSPFALPELAEVHPRSEKKHV